MNRLFVSYKPINRSSNYFLTGLKRKYNVKKAGFSGTLDPFACGVLIVAFGQFPKLFRFLKKSPKSYRATLWLGAHSSSLDIERVSKIDKVPEFEKEKILEVLSSLEGELTYLPPKFSAKNIDGKRAYELAREGVDFELKAVTNTITDVKLINYCSPFLTFEITITEGGYIRSMGEIIADKLGVVGALSALERLHEGEFTYESEKPLDPTKYLNVDENFYNGDKEDILLGRKLKAEDFKNPNEGEYFVLYDKILTIIEIKDDRAHYLLNGVKLC